VKQRLKTVFDWARAAGHRSGENPVDTVRKGLPKQPERSGHHSALPYSEVPGFVEALRDSAIGEIGRLAFELLILTATRTSETLGAKRTEVDLEQKVWAIPADRMKAGREHRIPLSPRAVEIIKRALDLSAGSELVFASSRPDRPLSNMVFLMALRRMERATTAHGFRSAFRDWAAERTNFPREVAEMALAHVIKDKAEAAYRRGDLLEKRRALMDAWSAYVASTGRGKVIEISARRS
jgi:integrase